MTGVLVLNSCFTPLGYVDWQRAVSMLVTTDRKGVPLAVMFEADPEKTVRSPTTTVAFPRSIRLSKWTYVKHHDTHNLGDAGFATKSGVLSRDRYTCVYCGMPGDTIDHVFPTSRGGENSWENMAACCSRCNQRKADRTPDEARMPLRWHPWRPDLYGAEQRKVWRALEPA